jgi:hypothetical protein
VSRGASALAAVLAVAAGWAAEPATVATRFAVVLTSPVVPSWYVQLRVPGWTAVDDLVHADALIEVTGDELAVVWTAYRPAWDERKRQDHRADARVDNAALGLGTHRLVVTVRSRISGTVLATVDLSRAKEVVRCGDVPQWYLRRKEAWLPTPEGIAQHWCAQAWATGFRRTEQALRARLASASQ